MNAVSSWEERRALIQRVAAAARMELAEVEDLVDSIRPSNANLAEVAEAPDARERLLTARENHEKRVAAYRAKHLSDHVASRVLEVLRDQGPMAMLALSDEAAQGLVHPTLWKFATAYEPRKDGGRALAMPTGGGKTLGTVKLLQRLVSERAQEAVAKLGEKMRLAGSETDLQQAVSQATKGFAWARAIDLSNARSKHRLGEEAPLIETCIEAWSLLVIDDLGQEAPARAEVLFEVLAARYDAGRITVVTTGLTPSELETRYGAALIRRVVQAGGLPGKVIDLFPKGARS